jgi:hypothetical protein
MDLQKVELGMYWIDLAEDTKVAGFCEFGNELSDSIKCGKFFEYLRTSEILRKDSGIS